MTLTYSLLCLACVVAGWLARGFWPEVRLRVMGWRRARRGLRPSRWEHHPRENVWSYRGHTPYGDVTADGLTVEQVAQLADKIDQAIDQYAIVIRERSDVYPPGWREAECDCGWITSGEESPVKDAVRSHVVSNHVRESKP